MMQRSSVLGRDYIDGGKALIGGKGSGGIIHPYEGNESCEKRYTPPLNPLPILEITPCGPTKVG
jgi:hypothetical protein